MTLYLGENLISGVATPVQGARNIGQLVQSLLPISDAGLHLVDGALIDGSGMYASFVDYVSKLDLSASYFCTEDEWQASVAQYGVCGKFVYDATANTVRLPKVTGLIEGTINVNALGDLVEAGLPNITGQVLSSGGINAYEENPAGSAVFGTNQGSRKVAASASSNFNLYASLGFNASRSNSIYGNSDTVQPQTVKGFVYIVIATSAKTDVEVNIDNIATDVNGKADVDLSNITASGTSLISSYAMPSNKYVDLTLGASGTTYAAPANGWFCFAKRLGGTNQVYELGMQTLNETGVVVFTDSKIVSTGGLGAANALHATVPARKGMTCKASYNLTGETMYFRFIYAQGEV